MGIPVQYSNAIFYLIVIQYVYKWTSKWGPISQTYYVFTLSNQILILSPFISHYLIGQCTSDEDWAALDNLLQLQAEREPPNLEENETLFRKPPRSNTIVKLLKKDSEIIGFYVIRLKGT